MHEDLSSGPQQSYTKAALDISALGRWTQTQQDLPSLQVPGKQETQSHKIRLILYKVDP